MLMTSIAADKAKYKKMMVDWLVAMCLVLVLHYIMSFALTMSETVTSMLTSDLGKTIHVTIPDDNFGSSHRGMEYNTNLMGYVRLMIQATDLNDKIAFLALYIMLVIFTIRFTWTYLKRVLTMAFLTLIAPIVALTYPIDKASDGKAQAFDMWIKEFAFNALLQPLHLFLYLVLLGTAIDIAVENPLYAIACLGFIIGAEKLLKQMFGFNKASGGTLGTLAGAAGVTALASKTLTNLATGAGKGKGGANSGKVRTNDQLTRQGRDKDSTKPLASIVPGRNALPQINDSEDGGNHGQDAGNQNPNPNQNPEEPDNGRPVDDGTNQNSGQPDLSNLSDRAQERRDELIAEGFTPDDQEWQQAENELGESLSSNIQAQNENDIDASGSPDEEATAAAIRNMGSERTFSGVVAEDVANFGNKIKTRVKGVGSAIVQNNPFTEEGRKNLGNGIKTGVRKRAIGAWKAAPSVAYSAARGTLKTAARVGVAGLAGVIAATGGDGEQAAAAALGGAVAGGSLFEGTAGKAMHKKSISDAYSAGVYGSAIDARNAKADKQFLKSDEFKELYEKNYKGKKSLEEVKEAYLSYRQAGITDNSTIKKALELEDKYNKENPGDSKLVRENVQNIVQSKDMIKERAFYNDAAKEKEIQRLQELLPPGGTKKQRRQTAEQLFKGYEDFRNIL